MAATKHDYIIDFKNEVQRTIAGSPKTVLQFLEIYITKPTRTLISYAYITSDSDDIIYKTEEGDIRRYPKANINEFIFNVYNNIYYDISGEYITGKSKTSKPYYSIKILGKQLPLAVYLLVSSKKATAFDIMELPYQFKDKKDNDAGVVMSFKDLDGNRKYLCLYPKTQIQWYFANGLNMYKIKELNLEPTLDGLSEALGKLLVVSHGAGFVRNLLEIENKFIDGSTLKILEDTGYHTNIPEIFAHDMTSLLSQRTTKSQYDLDNFRLRMSETITSVAYKQMHQAIAKYKSTRHLSKEKIVMKNDYIIKNLLAAGILQQTKTLNPVEEMMLSMKVTKTGIGNTLKSQVTLNRRDINPSYFGMLAPTATNEYGGIGVNQTLTNGAVIDDRFGSISKKEFTNDGNPFTNLSPIESLSPFFEYDDTTRRVMGNQQSAQFVQLEKPDVPLVQTGFESYVPHLVSDRFSKKALEDGKIISVSDEMIRIKYKSGKEDSISITPVKSRTKRGIFIATNYNVLVSNGQTVSAGQILATTDSLKQGKLAVGRNLVVAEMGYMGMNYEDGWVVSDTLNEKYSNKILQKINIVIPKDAVIGEIKLEEGKSTETGDVLIKYNTSADFIDDNDDGSDEYESTMVGLETNGLTKIYRSPGGVIREIVIKINNKQIPKQVLALHKRLTDAMSSKLTSCQKATAGLENEQEAYMECIGHLENVEALSIGGHKLNQEEIDGAIIEVYIERNNPVINGSKFTLASSGGKGTVQYIMEHGKEPIAVETGLKVEFVGTPLSIISRKNPSILLNMYLGKVIYFLNRAVVELNKAGKYSKIQKLVLDVFSLIDRTKDSILLNQLHEFFKQPNAKISKIINASDPLNNPAFPAIVPPFTNHITIKEIKAAADLLGVPLNEKVQVQENHGITTYRDVPVGILPIYMLEHFPQAMSSTRGTLSTGRSFITGQGRSGTKEGTGAIKIGEYDLKALLSKQAYGLVKELHSTKSDALQAKKQMLNTIIRTNEIPDELSININQEDLTTMNMVKILFAGAGLDSNI